jgi:hypothetical protein
MTSVTAAAALLPQHRRNSFLRSVANRLSDYAYGQPSDYDVSEACVLVLSGLGVAGGC